MTTINKKLKIIFFFALALSVGFPLGVLGIIFGAINKAVFLLVLGIIFAVAGFYVMPILWVKYGDLRHERMIVFMIENEHLRTVSSIATQTGYSEKDIRDRIVKLIRNHTLTGYLFINDTLELNTNEDRAEISERMKGKTMICSQCGAPMPYDGDKFKCEYCGFTSFCK